MKNLSRRTWLKAAAFGPSTGLLAQIMGQIEAQAAGAAKRPCRIVFVVQSNGFQTYGSTPVGLNYDRNRSKLLDVPLADYKLPDDLSPLEPFKERVTIVQGLQGTHVGPYHGGSFGALAGLPKGKNHSALGQTIDAALAKALPAVFPIVGLGLDANHHATQAVYVCSAWGADQTVATQCNPMTAYQSLFGSVASANKEFDARTNLLDFLKDDIKDLKSDVAGPERDKLDSHLNALESISKRQQQLREMTDTLRKNAPKADKRYTSLNECERLEAQFDIAAAALMAGLTNVVTICSCLCCPNGKFTGLGLFQNIHSYGHGGPKENTIIRKFHIGLVAGLAKKLAVIPEGNGSMLDNTLIVYTSDSADSHHSNGRNWPFVLIGGLAGKLRSGRYLEFPAFGQTGNRSINALYCTLLHAAGSPRDQFNLEDGQRDLDKHGPLTDLMT